MKRQCLLNDIGVLLLQEIPSPEYRWFNIYDEGPSKSLICDQAFIVRKLQTTV
jgi:hypothetical protein